MSNTGEIKGASEKICSDLKSQDFVTSTYLVIQFARK